MKTIKILILDSMMSIFFLAENAQHGVRHSTQETCPASALRSILLYGSLAVAALGFSCGIGVPARGDGPTPA